MPETDRAHHNQTVIRKMLSQFAPVDVDDLTPDTRLIDDLGYHSLALLELAYALEDEFGLPPLDEETARDILTVRDIEDLVAQRLSAAERRADAT
jgi:acyl carrier protein